MHSRGKTRISPTHVWMSAFTESVSDGLSDPSQDSPLLLDDSAIAWRPRGSSQKVTVVLIKTLHPQQFQVELLR